MKQNDVPSHLIGRHQELGSWKAVAVSIGLAPEKKSYVHAASRGKKIKIVFNALGVEHEAVEVQPCYCGKVHVTGTCQAGKDIVRLNKIRGRMIDVHPAAAKRMGIKPGLVDAAWLLKNINRAFAKIKG